MRMIGKLLVGGLCLAVGAGAFLGWRLARGVATLQRGTVAWAATSERDPTPEFAPDAALSASPDLRSTGLVQLQAPELAPLRAPVPAEAAATSARALEGADGRAVVDPGAPGELASAMTPIDNETPATAEELGRCVEALRDDAVRGNAMAALRVLLANGPRALPALERALQSEDEQQRTLAACACARIPGYSPTPELARILEGLLAPGPGEDGRDITPRPWIDRIGRADLDERGTAFWTLCGDFRLFLHAEARLEERLQGPPSAARFDAAYVIVQHARARSRAQAFEVLVEHLADNRLTDDAAQAMRQLARAPDEALPAVRAALPGRDEQQSRLLRHFLASFEPWHGAALRLEPKALSGMGFHRGDMLAAERAERDGR